MPARPIASGALSERERWFWLLVGGVALGQLFAFWLLCQWQVDKARLRHASLHADQVATAECSGATFIGADGTLVRAAPGPRCEVVRQGSGKSAD